MTIESDPRETPVLGTGTKFGERYHRHRPFLIIDSIDRPARNVKTHVKGWTEQSQNWDRTEHPIIVDRVSNKHLMEADFIFDILNEKVVKSRFNDVPNEQMMAHYMNKYAAEIARGVQLWTTYLAGAVVKETENG